METMASLALDYNQLQSIPDCLGTCRIQDLWLIRSSLFFSFFFFSNAGFFAALQPRVTKVTLSHNQFTSTPSLGSTVTWLDLSWNNISVVDENVSQLVLLQHLDMRHNRLTSRSLPDLSDLTFLEYLDVSENLFTSYPRLAPGCPLKILKVGYNLELGDPHDAVGPFPVLEHFSCVYTRLKIFPKFLMSSNQHLHTLDMSNTHISRLPMKLNFPRLTTFNISATKFVPSSEASAEIHDPNWRPPAQISDEVQASLRGLAHLHSTTTLHLSGVGLLHLPPSMFETLPVPSDSGSDIQSAEGSNSIKKAAKEGDSSDSSTSTSASDNESEREGSQKDLSRAAAPLLPLSATLTRLYLRWNNLFTLPDALFDMVQLECLDVLGNKLEQLSPSIGRLVNLQHLSLGHNRLMTLPIEITQLTHLEMLVLEHNIWEDPSLETLFWATDGVQRIFERIKEKSNKKIEFGYRKTLPELKGSAEEQLKDRVMGLIFGKALGDAIGLCSEFMTHTQATYSCNTDKLDVVDMHRDRHRVRWLQGDWTDDTDQAILLIETLLTHPTDSGLLDDAKFAEALLQWAKDGFPELGDDGGMGIGQTVSRVLHHPAYLNSARFASTEVWIDSGCNVAANGALMRCAPLALFGFWENYDAAKDAARKEVVQQRIAKYQEEEAKKSEEEKKEAANKKGEKVPASKKNASSGSVDKLRDDGSSKNASSSSTPSSPAKSKESKPGSGKRAKKDGIKDKNGESSSTGASGKVAAIGDPVSSLGRDAGLVRLNTAEACYVTHIDPRCVASCLALNMAIVAILRGERDMETILKIAFDEGKQAYQVPPVKGALHTPMYADWTKELEELIFTQQLDQMDLSDASRMGYTYKSLGAAFATLRNTIDFERAMIKITLCGGDADTNGAIAGALLGTVVGYHALPGHWLSSLPHFEWLHSRAEKVWEHIKMNVFPSETSESSPYDVNEASE